MTESRLKGLLKMSSKLTMLKMSLWVLTVAGVAMVWRNGAAVWMRSSRQTTTSVKSVREHTANVSPAMPGVHAAPYLVARDVTWQEPWPEVEADSSIRNHVYAAVHYVWCGAGRMFGFQHYLGVLSALRVLKPLRLIFHCSHGPPVADEGHYNTWFEELNSTVPFLEIRPILEAPPCKSKQLLMMILNIINQEGGGVFLGEHVSLARAPSPSELGSLTIWFTAPLTQRHVTLNYTKTRGLDPWCSSHNRNTAAGYSNGSVVDYSRCLVFVRRSFDAEIVDLPLVLDVVGSGNRTCPTTHAFDDLVEGQGQTQDQGHARPQCVSLPACEPVQPVDIYGTETPFAELARWLFYGKRHAMHVRGDEERLIPRITHYVRLERRSNSSRYSKTLSFYHYLSILSALHVAGFERVYLHVRSEPSGRWWNELRGENVTLLYLHTTHTVFQQTVSYVKHISDGARFNIVYRYGGAYQDFDVIWTSRVPDALLAYPAVITRDVVFTSRPWSNAISVGLFMAKPRADFIRHYLKTFRRYIYRQFLYNSDKMAHRTWEYYPDTVHIDQRLQMICTRNECHPHWLPGRWDLNNSVKGRNHNWSQAHAIHVAIPKLLPSFLSTRHLKEGVDMYADIGRAVLRKSGKLHLLEDEEEEEEEEKEEEVGE